ncbi:HTH-type transcriptional regulator immR, partial [Dysosmobacter welbionis]
GGDPLGDDELGGIRDLLQKRFADQGVGLGVHGGGGVVQDQDLGVLQQGPGDAKPLLLPAGDVGAALLDIGVVLVGELLDKGVRLGQLAHPDHLLVSGVLFAPAEIILDGAGEQHVLLQHHGHLVPQGVHIVVPDVRAAHQDAALSG